MEKSPVEICPYLGLKDDPETSISYPSVSNVCLHSINMVTPNLNYQKSVCLTKAYLDCFVYLSPDEKKMPESLQDLTGQKQRRKNTISRFALILLVVFLISSVLIFRGQWSSKIEGLLMPAWQKTQQVRTYQPLPTMPATQFPEIEYTPTSNQTRNSTATPTQSPMRSPTITMVPSTLALETPIGSWVQFIIHRTLPGESLDQFANQYNTTVDAIRSVNYNLPNVLYVDRLIIIPIGVKDAVDLPAFEAYQVTARGLGVDDLAEQLSVLPEDLVSYNNVPLDYIFNYGDWILVPRE
ncbi:MAG: LysM peptidoglycan-binding domain-containing protein [Brevefilum sp.]|nr:LysM peptidoglycan-binding domain-containing protein [Brevefilum sp.]